MRENDVVEMGERDRSYWWHVSRRNIWRAVLQHYLPPVAGRRILDVGCGSGFNLQLLRTWGEVVGIDQSPAAVESAHRYGPADVGSALVLPHPDASQDLVTAWDVLEHLPDDAAALREWARVLKPGGYLAISVPAYQWLFSPHDRELAHYRRYSRPELINKLNRAGFQTVFSSYCFMFTFPIFVAQRLLSRGLKRTAGYNPAPAWINQPLIWLGYLEAQLMQWFSLPFGSSIVVLVRKL
jgi:ubiquinone/menaquinone biosynthesis C-methylase UbiE